MKIGFYKLGITKNDINLQNDKNGRFKELLALVEIFKNRGHEVYLLDKNDEVEGFHKIYVLNGVINLDENLQELQYLRRNTLQLNYILTDLRLICKEIIPYFDIIYTQAMKPIKFIKAKQLYSGMPELAMYCSGLTQEQIDILYDYDNFNKRNNLFVFGGNYKDRQKDIEKYIIKNGFKYFGKDKDGNDNRLPIDKYHRLLKDTKYSILIQDKLYNKVGFITWRYYENIVNGVITFIDKKCDKDGLIPLSKEMRKVLTVKTGNELKLKMEIFENNIFFKRYILFTQRKMITDDKLSGEYTYNKLMQM